MDVQVDLTSRRVGCGSAGFFEPAEVIRAERTRHLYHRVYTVRRGMLLDLDHLKMGLLRFRDGSRRRNIDNLRYFSALGRKCFSCRSPPSFSRPRASHVSLLLPSSVLDAVTCCCFLEQSLVSSFVSKVHEGIRGIFIVLMFATLKNSHSFSLLISICFIVFFLPILDDSPAMLIVTSVNCRRSLFPIGQLNERMNPIVKPREREREREMVFFLAA